MKKLHFLSLLLLCSLFFTYSAGAQSFSTSSSSSSTSSSPSIGGGGGATNPYFITVDSANKMLESYLSSINADVDTNTNVQSFIMDADAIREYLADNSIKKVKIMLAHTLNYINSGKGGVNCGYRAGKLTIIMAGFDADKNYIFAPGNKVPDGAIPCPENCVTVGTAADMTLH